MAEKQKEVDWPPCQLMLTIEPGPGARGQLKAAFGAGLISVVMIRPKVGQQLGAGEVKPLVDLAQDEGAAAILCDNVELARILKADGVHLSAGMNLRERLTEARVQLGPDANIGADAGHSRHNAMEAGESGADYVAFGVADGTPESRQQRDDFVAWWAEIFEIPCVVLDIETIDEVDRADLDGADFVALTVRAGEPPDKTAERVGMADMRLQTGPTESSG